MDTTSEQVNEKYIHISERQFRDRLQLKLDTS